MERTGLVILDFSAALIAAGGFYDIFAPLPANLRERCGTNEDARELVHELLRALGFCLVGIGVAVGLLANGPVRRGEFWSLAAILLLVVPAESMNSIAMRRVGSPYYFPLAFIGLTVVGAALVTAAGLR